MGDLKPGWRRVKFGDVVRQVKDKVDPETCGLERYVAGEHMDTDDLRIRRWGDIGDGYLGPAFHMRFKPGQVLYGSRRTYLRKAAVADFEGICANTTFVLESADPQRLLPELLPFVMHTEAFHEHSKRESKGSVNPYVNFSDLAWYEFALPPIEKQRGAIAPLHSMEAFIKTLSDCLFAAHDWEQALLKWMFPVSKTTHDTEVLPLERLALIKLGYKVSPVHVGERVSKPIITVAQIQDGYFDLESVKSVTIPERWVSSFRPKAGSLLITEGGNLDQLGRGAVWKEEYGDCIFQNHVFQITPSDKRIRAEYLEGLMRSPRGRDFFLRNAKRTSNLATIDQKKVRTMPVPLTSERSQEQWIEKYIAAKEAYKKVQHRMECAILVRKNLNRSVIGGE